MKRRILPLLLAVTMVVPSLSVCAEDIEAPVEVIEASVESTEASVEATEVSAEENTEEITKDLIADTVNTQLIAESFAEQIEETIVEDVEEDPEVETYEVGIRVPDGFAVEFGYQASYKHTYIAESVDQNNVWVFKITNDKGKDVASGNYFYRVYSVEENNDAVTYWGWLTAAEFKEAKGSIIEVTEDMLCINDEGKTVEVEIPVLNAAGQETGETETKEVSIERNADTVDEYLTNNQYDTQDILITGNENGYVNLKVGDTWTLNCYRMWEIIESFMNAQISQPDFHIEVVGVDGNETDIVDITKNTGDGSANTITAVKPGTVILKITYDAVTVDSAMGGSYFSAIAPENTALFVISVEGADINDGIDLDSEVDVQYYSDDNGATVKCAPDEGSTVRVARCGYDSNNKMQLSIFEDVEINEDGTFDITALREGSAVVEVTDSEGNKSYQVIKSKQMKFFITDSEGNVITDMSTVKPGDHLTITADKFYDVFMKSAGVYNGSCCLQFTDNYGNLFKSKENAAGFAISYDQAGNPVYRTVEVIVPDDYAEGEDYVLDCNIYRDTRFGLKLTGHRTVYKNTGETKVNGYVVSVTDAKTVSDANIQISEDTKLLDKLEVNRNHSLIGTEILIGSVVTMNNSKVEYKNKEN